MWSVGLDGPPLRSIVQACAHPAATRSHESSSVSGIQQWVATDRSGRRNFGAGDLLEVEQADGRKSLIPFKSGIADLQDGRIVPDSEFLA